MVITNSVSYFLSASPHKYSTTFDISQTLVILIPLSIFSLLSPVYFNKYLFFFCKSVHFFPLNLIEKKVSRWGGINYEFRINVYTLCKIVNKELQFSTGNSTQFSVINHMGKESEKEWMYACMPACSCFSCA